MVAVDDFDALAFFAFFGIECADVDVDSVDSDPVDAVAVDAPDVVALEDEAVPSGDDEVDVLDGDLRCVDLVGFVADLPG